MNEINVNDLALLSASPSAHSLDSLPRGSQNPRLIILVLPVWGGSDAA